MTEQELEAGKQALRQYLAAQSSLYASMVSDQQYRDAAWFVIDAVDTIREGKAVKP